MVKILICESHHKTELFIRAARSAFGESAEIHLLSVLPVMKKRIKKLDSGIFLHDLFISPSSLKGERHKVFDEIYRRFVDDNFVSFSRIFASDRRLRLFPKSIRERYAGFVIQKLDAIFSRHKFDLILMEATWCHEQIVCLFAQNRGVKLAIPVNDKIASGRFNVFNCPLRLNPYVSQTSLGEEELSAHVSQTVTFATLKKRNVLSLAKLARMSDAFITTVIHKRNRFIHQPFFMALVSQLRNVVRYQVIMRSGILSFSNDSQIAEIAKGYKGGIVLYLHVQPEASIDVLANEFQDQIGAIEDIRKMVPNNFAIFVKDHPHDVGRKSIRSLRKISNLNDVYLVSPSVSSECLINKFNFFHATFAGTIAIEAAMSGRNSACFAETFFTRCGLVSRMDSKFLYQLYEGFDGEKIDRSEVEKALERFRFVGNVGAPNIDKRIMDRENIVRVGLALRDILLR